MTTDLHRTFEEHRISPSGLLWPSTVATVIFVGTLFVVWVYSLVVGWGTATLLSDSAFGQPLFLGVAALTAVLLIALTAFDVWRHTDRVWRWPRIVIGMLELVVLCATLVLLWQAMRLL